MDGEGKKRDVEKERYWRRVIGEAREQAGLLRGWRCRYLTGLLPGRSASQHVTSRGACVRTRVSLFTE